LKAKNGAGAPNGTPPRNRAFDLYKDPEVRRLRRAQRLLAAIGRDLARPGVRATLRARPVRVGGAERIRLEYEHPVMRLSRTAFLTTDELDRLRALVSSSHHLFLWLED
jgi:hypothetical protein